MGGGGAKVADEKSTEAGKERIESGIPRVAECGRNKKNVRNIL